MENGEIAYEPVLNPGADHVIQENEWLILLAHTERIQHDPTLRYPVRTGTDQAIPAAAPLERVLILGWNDTLYDILTEYDAYVAPGTEIRIVSNHDDSAARARLADFGTLAFRNIVPAFERGNTVLRSVIESLDARRFDCIVILADASHEESDPDARSIMSLILLQDLLGSSSSEQTGQPRLICEILDPRNRDLIARAHVQDIVISPQIVSMLLTQISQQQMLDSVYDILLSSGGAEIYLKPASLYAAAGAASSFAELAAAAQARHEIALGVSLAHGAEDGNSGVLMNPARDCSWILDSEDRVIVLAQDLYD